MIFSLTRFTLNLAALGPQALYQCNKAKKLYLQDNRQCVICGALVDLEVHHILPVHLVPELASDPINFVTLCDYGNKGCHLKFGHLGSFTNFNPQIQELIVTIRSFYEAHALKTIKFNKPFVKKGLPGRYDTLLENRGSIT